MLYCNQPIIYGPETVPGMYESGRIAALALDEVEEALRLNPYRTTLELDKIACDFIKAHNATPECIGYVSKMAPIPYSYATCISVNEVACHGVPSEYRLKDGDIVNVDLVVRFPAKDGWLADTSRSFAIGDISDEDRFLLEVAKGSMYAGMRMVKKWVEFRFIGAAIESYCKGKKINGKHISIIPEFCGHGVSKRMHELPYVEHVRNYCNTKMQPYHYFTIEPIIILGTDVRTYTADDKWTIKTKSNAKTAQFEHTIGLDADGKLMVFTTRDSQHEAQVLQEIDGLLK